MANELRQAFIGNKIKEFLNTHLKLNQLFTSKLQFIIETKNTLTHKHEFNVDNKLLEKIDLFNKNFNELSHDKSEGSLNVEGIKKEVKQNSKQSSK